MTPITMGRILYFFLKSSNFTTLTAQITTYLPTKKQIETRKRKQMLLKKKLNKSIELKQSFSEFLTNTFEQISGIDLIFQWIFL